MSPTPRCRSCDKRSFVKMDQARMAAAIQWKYDGVALWIYPCPYEAGLHLTTSPPQPRPRSTTRRHDHTYRRRAHRSRRLAGTASRSGAR